MYNPFKKKKDVIQEPVRMGFWSNPIFDNDEVLKLYKNELLRVGHCPVCDDFLFIDISLESNHYKVVKRCISHECDYTEDISFDFNRKLGITIFTEPVKEKVKSSYKPNPNEILDRGNVNSKSHFWELSSNSYISNVAVDELPLACEDTLNKVYVLNEYPYEIYVTVREAYDDFEWLKVAERDNLSDDFSFCVVWDKETMSYKSYPERTGTLKRSVPIVGVENEFESNVEK